MKDEVWKDIPGYEGYYQASTLGRIKSLERVEVTIIGSPKPIKERILKPSIGTTGYYFLNLCKNRIPKLWKVHRIIGLTFLPKPDSYNVINHIDGNKLNNKINNLEWCTQAMNNNHSHKMGLIKNPPRGELHSMAKLTNSQANEIRAKYKPWIYTMSMLSREYGVDSSIISGIIMGTRYVV